MEAKLIQNRFKVRTNYFPIVTNITIFKYQVIFDPELEGNGSKTIQTYCRKLHEKFSEYFGVHFIYNDILLSSTSKDEFIFDCKIEDADYNVTVKKCGMLYFEDDKSLESQHFLARFLKTLQRIKALKMIGRKYFMPSRSQNYQNFGLDIWPGFETSLHNINGKFYYNVDCSFKVLRQETVLKRLEELRNRDTNAIKEEFVGTTVITKYNNLLYRITDICFDKTPMHQFQDQKGNSISLVEYYNQKYGIKISNIQQPLILNIDEKTKKEVLLIPELCSMTGLSDAQRNNFGLMKAIAGFTKPPPSQRCKEYQGLIKLVMGEQENKNLSKWGIKIDPESLVSDAHRFIPGNYIMGNNQHVELESRELDRNVQTQMYSQPNLQSWTIIYSSANKRAFDSFSSTFQTCLQTFKYPVSIPKIKEVQGDARFDNWRRALSELDPSTQLVVAILDGPKKNARHYSDIKRLLTVDYSIPSQVVQTKTLDGKGLRSICNKILIQICAKVGGIPWNIDNLPFTDQPTMVCGLDVYHQTKLKNKSVLALCATVDRGFSRYWSTVRVKEVGQEIGIELQTLMEEAISNFGTINKIAPSRIIFFRDGIAAGQRKTAETIEVSAIRRASQNLNLNIKLVYITINKRINSKFFIGDDLKRVDSLKNPPEGTCVPGLGEEFKDFFLVSHKTTQGSATPSHYHIMVNDLITEDKKQNEIMFEKMQALCFKLCFQYFNWVGAIKTPAPAHYAHKLAELIGDKFKGDCYPNDQLGKKSSLYFI